MVGRGIDARGDTWALHAEESAAACDLGDDTMNGMATVGEVVCAQVTLPSSCLSRGRLGAACIVSVVGSYVWCGILGIEVNGWIGDGMVSGILCCEVGRCPFVELHESDTAIWYNGCGAMRVECREVVGVGCQVGRCGCNASSSCESLVSRFEAQSGRLWIGLGTVATLVGACCRLVEVERRKQQSFRTELVSRFELTRELKGLMVRAMHMHRARNATHYSAMSFCFFPWPKLEGYEGDVVQQADGPNKNK
ncbi:hypothetical protein B0T20DRAFT_398172 [Sordaria brevicollis]|uniref:Uncharacterized protein n=1 Tax=Sordaria brevicollis TaxID=83679 RepID=A0AAE0NRH9_SORBR|nr:hypothetical protein B0T20DRAFT_398172 [Sordaria brevicollis]